MAATPSPIVYTHTAKCRDCYRCLRVCPVGAIGVRDGQAFVDDTRCIQCGTCIRECPQHARTYRGDTDDVKALLHSGARVAASIAPSFVSIFKEWEISRLPSALRQLGFTHIGETGGGSPSGRREERGHTEEPILHQPLRDVYLLSRSGTFHRKISPGDDRGV